jgi:protein-L-isoaspartate(D-aspartate) O-methyltransferase
LSNFDLQGIGMTSQRTRDRLVARLRDQGIVDEKILRHIASLPRHIFIDEALAHRAYEDTSLPIGHNQTISQPFIVALMTQLLTEVPRRKVLEVGTGSGYQTALLAGLCERVLSIERIKALMPKARERLSALSLRNIQMRHGDGYAGWPEHGPFDGILVTAAPPVLPEQLLEQLVIGGRLIVPVGDGNEQDLRVIDRTENGFVESVHDRVKFVPLLGGVTHR